MAEAPVSIHFVCIGNMCRSPLAEAFARHWGREKVRASSSGLQASGSVHSIVLELLEERAIATDELTSTPFAEARCVDYDWVVSMAGIRAEAFVPEDYAGQTRFWPIPDPIGQPREVFEEVARDVEAHVLGLLKELGIVEPTVGQSAWAGFDLGGEDEE